MSDPQLTLSTSTSGDDLAVQEAVDRGRTAAGLYPRGEALWRWWARENPRGVCIGSARDGAGQVVAAIVGLTHDVRMAGENVRWIEVVDIYNAFDRGAGLSRARPLLALGKSYAQAFAGRAPEGAPVLYGLPDRRAHRLGLRHLRWEVLRSENALCAELDRLSPPSGAGIEILEVERFPADIAPAFERFSSGREAVLIRDADHMNWRFASHPTQRYRIALARQGGEVRGWAVYRSGGWGPEASGLLCDWIVPPGEEGAAGELVTWAAGCARADGFERLTVNVPDKAPEFGAFQDIGFRVHGTEDYVAFRSFQKPYVMSWLFANWYYTLGDSGRC